MSSIKEAPALLTTGAIEKTDTINIPQIMIAGKSSINGFSAGFNAWFSGDLEKSVISPEIAKALYIRPVCAHEISDILGFRPDTAGQPLEGYSIPFPEAGTNGWKRYLDNGRTYYRIRLRFPAKMDNDKDAKYLSRKGSGLLPYIIPATHKYLLENETGPLILTEGEKKAICAGSKSVPVIGLPGIWGWMAGKGDKSLHPDLRPYMKAQRKLAVMVYDSDAEEPNKKDDFMHCAEALSMALNPYGVTLDVVILPNILSNGKTGLDDYMLSHSSNEFFECIATNSIRIPDPGDRRKITSTANGKDGGRQAITKNIADDFGKEFTDDKNNFLLKYYRGNWFKWTEGKIYREIPEDDVQANIMGFLRKQYPDNATKNMQANVIANLQSSDMAWVDSLTVIPSYIEPQTQKVREAGDIIVMNNVVVKPYELIKCMEGENIPKESIASCHAPELFSTLMLPYDFIPDAPCPKWESYVKTVLPENESQDALQMLFGLSLLPVTKYNVFFVLFGEGGSGKSVALHVLEHLVGSENICALPLGNIMDHFSTHLLTEKLLNIVGDLPTEDSNGYSLAKIEGALKDITSGGNLPVERKFKDPTMGAAIARCVFATNTLPRFADRSNGVWDRLRIIPFNNVIRDTPEDNKNLKYELVAEEMPGIFIWAVKGLAQLMRLKSFPDVPDGRAVKDKHRLACDHERSFLEEALIVDNNAFISAQELYQLYKQFCINNGYRNKHEGNFAEVVPKVFPGAVKKRQRMDGGRQIFVWSGIRKNENNC
ncbi:MAG: hypothetical protein A2017_09250 [Lentisphaerae bacterium GWF2_44_16]|nr:MAG: hypothetical protein A2017_09250 [Lentisphaerae bacterium GWF2_44_16]